MANSLVRKSDYITKKEILCTTFIKKNIKYYSKAILQQSSLTRINFQNMQNVIQ